MIFAPIPYNDADMYPKTFIAKWNGCMLTERSIWCLDAAVAAAYSWADWNQGLSDDEILNRLLAENLRRKPVAP